MSIKTVIFLLGFLTLAICPAKVFPADRTSVFGAREAALAQAVVALPGYWCVFQNQGFLVENTRFSFATTFRQPYRISGFSEGAFAIVYPAKFAVYSFGYTQGSIGAYRELNAGLAMAKNLGRQLSAGLLFNYFSVSFPEAGRQKGLLAVDLGVRFRKNDRTTFGFQAKNVFKSTIETFQNSISPPLILRAGIAIVFNSSLLLSNEIRFMEETGFNYCAGLEYKLSQIFCFRLGMDTHYFAHSIGLGYCLSNFQMDFALVHDKILGYTPSITFVINLKK